MEKYCDNKSVGVVLINEDAQMALLERAVFPVGMAPPAGHIDTHGGAEQAAVDEVSEELGVTIAISGLRRTAIHEQRVTNVCSRQGDNYHDWTVFEAKVSDSSLRPDQTETKGAAWFDMAHVQRLADRTRAYIAGEISEQDWTEHPGLEPVWLDFLVELGYVNKD